MSIPMRQFPLEMEFQRNPSLLERTPCCIKFRAETLIVQKGGDGNGVSLEWLSVFVEECLNGGGFACQQTPIPPPPQSSSTNPTASPEDQSCKPMKRRGRGRRRRRPLGDAEEGAVVSLESDPLVPQAYWLAESELIIFPKRKDEEEEEEEEERKRRCTHCLSQKTPQWRAGPLGPKTLCNACGVRFKSGRLLPEYRPAKSPTFESYKHSNSHKKIIERRNNMAASTTPSSRAN